MEQPSALPAPHLPWGRVWSLPRPALGTEQPPNQPGHLYPQNQSLLKVRPGSSWTASLPPLPAPPSLTRPWSAHAEQPGLGPALSSRSLCRCPARGPPWAQPLRQPLNIPSPAGLCSSLLPAQLLPLRSRLEPPAHPAPARLAFGRSVWVPGSSARASLAPASTPPPGTCPGRAGTSHPPGTDPAPPLPLKGSEPSGEGRGFLLCGLPTYTSARPTSQPGSLGA